MKTKLLVWLKGKIFHLVWGSIVKLYSSRPSNLLRRVDWSVSFTSSRCVFFIQSFAFVLCFSKIRALIHWFLNTLTIQRSFPGFLDSSSFFSCRHVGMIFQCNCVILFNLFFSPPNTWQRLSVLVVFVPSFQNKFYSYHFCCFGFSSTYYVLWSTCFAAQMVHVWLHGKRILIDDVARNWQDVESFLVHLSIPFRRMHAPAACAVYDANFPI